MSYISTLPQPVLHGDVKLENFLVDEGFVVKVFISKNICTKTRGRYICMNSALTDSQ